MHFKIIIMYFIKGFMLFLKIPFLILSIIDVSIHL